MSQNKPDEIEARLERLEDIWALLEDKPDSEGPEIMWLCRQLRAARKELAEMRTRFDVVDGLATERMQGLRQVRAERDEARAELAAALKDRARFPDRPDGIGRMIGAHIGNLETQIADVSRAWQREQLDNHVLRQHLAIVREALEFYADPNDWSGVALKQGDEYQTYEPAREALAKIEAESTSVHGQPVGCKSQAAQADASRSRDSASNLSTCEECGHSLGWHHKPDAKSRLGCLECSCDADCTGKAEASAASCSTCEECGGKGFIAQSAYNFSCPECSGHGTAEVKP